MSKIDDLRQEADELGITYNAKIGEAKLSEKIEAFYTAQETPAPVLKKEEVIEEPEPKKIVNTMRARANKAEAAARKERIVVIVDNDQRENHLTTTVSVNCSNDYFDLGTRRIPLNTPVEVAQGYIDVLKEIKIPMHIVNARTGLSQYTTRARYSVSYEDDLKKD